MIIFKNIKISNAISTTIYLLFILILMIFIVKGQINNTLLNQDAANYSLSIGSPFEISGSTSRYALTEAIVENKTFFLDEKKARFASPDVVEANGYYLSIFTPGVSFIGVPFYLLGKIWNLPQLFTYFSTIIFAILNSYLIFKLVKSFGVNSFASMISGIIFLFATNSLSYSLTYTQHHMSTFILLYSLYLLIKPVKIVNSILIGVLYGLSLFADVPNMILNLPIIIALFIKHINFQEKKNYIVITPNIKFISFLFGVILLIIPFCLYNYQVTHSYTSLPQFIGRAPSFDINNLEYNSRETEIKESNNGISLPFKTRNQLHGLYILLISNERGILYYSPILIIGLLELLLLYKNKDTKNISIILITTIFINLLLYSMFGDVYGGWAFGARYMIPSYALLSITLGISINKYKAKTWFILLFSLLTIYSVAVNVLGAMTTVSIPPKVEAVNLSYSIPYTYEYNWQLMTKNNFNSALIYNLFFAKNISSLNYAKIYLTIILTFIFMLYGISVYKTKK